MELTLRNNAEGSSQVQMKREREVDRTGRRRRGGEGDISGGLGVVLR